MAILLGCDSVSLEFPTKHIFDSVTLGVGEGDRIGIVGKNGETLKLIGTYARQDLERILGTKVYLNLWVKVKENWRDSVAAIGNFGYKKDTEE